MKITLTAPEVQVVINALVASDPLKIYLGDLVQRIGTEATSQMEQEKAAPEAKIPKVGK